MEIKMRNQDYAGLAPTRRVANGFSRVTDNACLFCAVDWPVSEWQQSRSCSLVECICHVWWMCHVCRWQLVQSTEPETVESVTRSKRFSQYDTSSVIYQFRGSGALDSVNRKLKTKVQSCCSLVISHIDNCELFSIFSAMSYRDDLKYLAD